MCLGTWLRWDIQQNVSTGLISVFLFLFVFNGAKSRNFQGHGRPSYNWKEHPLLWRSKGRAYWLWVLIPVTGCFHFLRSQLWETHSRAAHLPMREPGRTAGFNGDARSIFRSHLFLMGNGSKCLQVLQPSLACLPLSLPSGLCSNASFSVRPSLTILLTYIIHSLLPFPANFSPWHLPSSNTTYSINGLWGLLACSHTMYHLITWYLLFGTP